MRENLNVEFIEEYKKLDNFCNDMFGVRNGGVTAYIDKMKISAPNDKRKYREWDEDFGELKRLRAIRNKIVHESNGFSYALCDEGDIASVTAFRNRLMNRADPLVDSHFLHSGTSTNKNDDGLFSSDMHCENADDGKKSSAAVSMCLIELIVIIGLIIALILK